ncbi:response regulator transcription factor [Thiocapsa rosea]|uniref:AraC family two component transcriptional regulator n=1 Tax=Thiocapsa rosea TaxID=69360 RepID=A0A495V345_9GAMM|nr:DNA-binding response regulator [Thiocapsa rosea]RKT43832.1 AraC family two component transcriptional regulator [Thiocapsa rosea]
MTDNMARILIIDDQPASIGLLIAYLQGRDIDLLVAQTGEDGLRIAAEGQPDLILLDVRMQGLDGFTVCRRLKASPKTSSIPVIFLSSSIETEDKLRGFAAGATDYITKPFSEQEVLARVYLQIGDHQQVHALSRQALDELEDIPLSASANRLDQRLFMDAVAVLIKRLVDPPSAVALAHQVGTNQQRLTRIFREQVGMSAYEYLQEMRLERGRSLLLETDLQIQLIADRVGYRNAGDFTRAFGRHFGVTPKKYRQGRLQSGCVDGRPDGLDL